MREVELSDRYPILYRGYGEIEIGDRQITRGRTITEGDITNWCALTGDWFYLHTDAQAAKTSIFGRIVAPGIMVFAMATGLGVPADSTAIVANYGSDSIRYPNPTFVGDTIHLEAEVIAKDDKGTDRGVVSMRWQVFNQEGTLVCTSVLKVLVATEVAPYEL
ncbi:MAG: MaoC/PaaZ C-terminal domain-containing protein [Ferrimicrobium sp.]|jgi:acyl dehydratase|uniref:MaoC/PaaZ C-terminal domain-containing protein n=1 Tax=Ferrimicrobium acidiphilum TaxID=121039 RepID=A0ABV3Y0V3_9ACTN|nr:MaoC/PaaZ C-terminal domain-containing protein [Ferrimicrobium sp.]MCL5973860.1 MaoC family dehydratase N-terminal domain-containing protein [Actinomycetota bacterium]